MESTAEKSNVSRRTWSQSSRRSERVQEVKEASEQLRRVTREQAKVAAEKKKLESEAITQREQLRATEEIATAKRRSKAAGAAAAIQVQHADLEAELQMLEADRQHALRVLDVVSEAYDSEKSGEWETRSYADLEETAGRTFQWAEQQGTRTSEREIPLMEHRDDERHRGTIEETAYAAAQPTEAATRPAAVAAARSAAGTAARYQAARCEAAAGATLEAVAAAANAAPAAGPSTRDGTDDSASEKLISKVCQVLSIASSKPHYNRELPVFSGDPLQFLAFKAIFYQSTEVMKLNDDQNLLRLQSAVRGRARDCISGLLLSPMNVGAIMNTLETLFGNPNVIIQRTLSDLRSVKALSENIEADALLKFSCQVKNLVATVKSVNKLEHLFNPDLLASLVAKLPNNLLMLWLGDKQRGNSDEPVIIHFATWLEALAIGSQDAGMGAGDMARKNQTGAREGKYKAPRSRNFVLNVTESTKCPHCSSDHYLSKCGKFKENSLDARWGIIKSMKRCFKCLAPSHGRKNCPAYKKFPRQKYHYLLTAGNTEQRYAGQSMGATEDSAQLGSIVTHTVAQNKVLLQVLPVTLMGPKGNKMIYALLDAGSTVSLLDRDIAEEVGIRGPSTTMEMCGVGEMRTSSQGAESVSFHIKGETGRKVFHIQAYSITALNLPKLKNITGGPRFHTAAAYKVGTISDVQPSLLIGANCWELILSRGLKRIDEGLSLSKTKLGWVPVGSVPTEKQVDTFYSFCTSDSRRDESHLQVLLEENLRLEQDWPGKKRVLADVKWAKKLLESTTSIKNGVWTTGLLWREGERVMPDSKPMALARLHSVERKMDRNRAYGDAYCQRIDQYVAAGYAEEITPAQLVGRKNIWFLPHMGVMNAAKGNKMRVVHDAAASVRGVSLNSLLLTGPDYYSSIIGILFRFREHPVAYTADIGDMFMRIKIIDEDTYSQLFLWRGFRRDIEPRILKMSSLIFGSKSSPNSAHYVRNKNAERFKDLYPLAVEAITDHQYVDDLLFGSSTIEAARRVINNINWIQAQGNFLLKGWASNSSAALDEIPEERKAKQHVALERGEVSSQRLLGLQWLPESDELTFNLRLEKLDDALKAGQRVPTKRVALKVVMSVFDILGVLSPITIRAKIIMQRIWSSEIAWDEVVTQEVFERWSGWLKVLRSATDVRIPRYHLTSRNTSENRQLHVYCDASQQAMCAVAYMRIVNDGEEPVVSFIASKTRVAPLKSMTIPRLELTAALLGAELAKKITSEYKIKFHERILWTDSRKVWWWIHSQSAAHQQFVANRLGVLDELTSPDEWRWSDGRSNPADDETRATSTIDISQESRWLNGPDYLRKPPEMWPSQVSHEPSINEKRNLEYRPVAVFSLRASITSLVDVNRFSQHRRLVRTTAYVMKFVRRCKRLAGDCRLDGQDVAEAEEMLVKESQTRCFGREIGRILDKKDLPRDSRLLGLNVYLDGRGLLRVGGRVENAPGVPYNTKRPMILDGRDRFTQLLVIRIHEEMAHSGVETVLARLRQSFWLISPRQTVKKLIYRCLPCTIRKAKPVAALMGQLPEARLRPNTRCFHSVGVDYWGPVQVTVRRKIEKRYGVLFTCLSTRATHIELAFDLSTNSAIQAIRRFIARRGKPHLIMSDNGRNLQGASAELKRAIIEIDDVQIRERLSNEQITWNFIPPGSPNHGGSWESVIKCTKRALHAILKERAPSVEMLQTLLTEVEAILNQRPLTHIALDSRDAEPLTPEHFLLGHPSGSRSMGRFNPEGLCSRKQWVQTQALADVFWDRWSKEILPTLVKRPKWNCDRESLKIGDLVLLLDPSLERGRWPRAIVEKIYPDRRGSVRIVDVRLDGKLYRRTIGKLVKLDVSARP